VSTPKEESPAVTQIKELIERSSLGTPSAREARTAGHRHLEELRQRIGAPEGTHIPDLLLHPKSWYVRGGSRESDPGPEPEVTMKRLRTVLHNFYCDHCQDYGHATFVCPFKHSEVRG
jgi:hypothetical protein